MPERNGIELRSPAVRKLLSQSPNWLIRWGSALVFLGLILFVCLSWFIPYSESWEGEVLVRREQSAKQDENRLIGLVRIPIHRIESLAPGQRAEVILGEQGKIKGKVEMVGERPELDPVDKQAYFECRIGLEEEQGLDLNQVGELRGKASVVTGEIRLFERIFGKVQHPLFN